MKPKRTVGRPKRTTSQLPPTSQRILETTEALLEQKGFAGTSMEDISASVGITKGTLYHHFASKDDLITQMLHGILDREYALTQAALATTSSAEEQLKIMANLTFARQQHTQRIMNMVRDAQRFLPKHLWQELFTRFMNEMYTPLELIMKHGIQTKEFAPHDTTFSAWAFMGLLSHLNEPQMSQNPNRVDELLHFVIHGVGRK